MFDPKSILDALVRGNAQQSPGASSGGGGLDELLRNFLPNAGAAQPRRVSAIGQSAAARRRAIRQRQPAAAIC